MPFLFGSQTRTSTSTPTFTAQQSQLQGQTEGTLASDLANPGVNLDPLQTAATGSVDNNYAALDSTQTQGLADNGFGRSGKVGSVIQNDSLSRESDLGSLSSQFAGYQLNQQNTNMNNALQESFADPGQTSVAPGSGWASGIGSLLGAAAMFV